MPTIALETIAAGEIKRAPHNNNYSAIQAAVNALDGTNFGAGALAATHIVRARVSGDSDQRLAIQADGKLLWGSGAIAGDTNLYRSAADTLKTDDAFTVVGNLTGNGAVFSTGVGANRVGFLDASGAVNPDTYVGLRYDSGSNRAELAALTGGVGWRDVYVGKNANLLADGAKILGTAGAGFVEFSAEQSADPAAPAANQARLFIKDSGGGKTQLAVRFNTGVVQVIATEP